MNLSEIKERFSLKEHINNAARRLRKNTVLSFFYEKLAEDIYFDDVAYMTVKDYDYWYRRYDSVKDRGERVALCTRFCKGDYYRLQGVKDLQRTNLCRDRFCDNCQNTISQQRYEKYLPVLEKLTADFDVYHIVFTVPNVYVKDLARTIDRMYKAYAYLVRYFDGRKSIRHIDFKQYGYKGSVRALEITKNRERNDFHPHLHCLFLLRKGQRLDENRIHINPYSFKNPDVKRGHHKNFVRYFGDFEILLQKVWRLLIDGVEVNYSNVEELTLGYSVICDQAKDRFKEIFKYATKGVLCVDQEKDPTGVYEDFCALFFILYQRKLIQGYGSLRHLKFEEDVDLSPDEMYMQVVQDLQSVETPDEYHEDFKDMHEEVTERKNITYISRKSVSHIFGKEFDGEKWELKQ